MDLEASIHTRLQRWITILGSVRETLEQCFVQTLNLTTNAAFDGIANDEDSLLHIQSARDYFIAAQR